MSRRTGPPLVTGWRRVRRGGLARLTDGRRICAQQGEGAPEVAVGVENGKCESRGVPGRDRVARPRLDPLEDREFAGSFADAPPSCQVVAQGVEEPEFARSAIRNDDPSVAQPRGAINPVQQVRVPAPRASPMVTTGSGPIRQPRRVPSGGSVVLDDADAGAVARFAGDRVLDFRCFGLCPVTPRKRNGQQRCSASGDGPPARAATFPPRPSSLLPSSNTLDLHLRSQRQPAPGHGGARGRLHALEIRDVDLVHGPRSRRCRPGRPCTSPSPRSRVPPLQGRARCCPWLPASRGRRRPRRRGVRRWAGCRSRRRGRRDRRRGRRG